MNRFFVGFLVLCYSIVWGSSALGTPNYLAAISYGEKASDSTLPDLIERDFSFGDLSKIGLPGNFEGIINDPKFAIVEGDNQLSLGGATGTAGAQASAGDGRLTVFAYGSASASGVFDNHKFVDVLGDGSASAIASLSDTITLHSGPVGAPFLVHSFWIVKGATSANASGTTTSHEPFVTDGFSSTFGDGSLRVNGTGLEIPDDTDLVAENGESNGA